MAPVTIDMDKLLADVARADEELSRAEQVVVAAVAARDAARAKRASVEQVLNMVRTYAVDAGERIAAGAVPAGPLKGKSATAALDAFAALNPGATVKVADAITAMGGLGFEGSVNAVQVAFASAWKAGKIERVRKGIYRFPDNESAAPPTGGTIQMAPPPPNGRTWSLNDLDADDLPRSTKEVET